MSTTIHHGYRLADGVDIFDFQTRLRTVMNPVRDRIDATWLMDHAVHGLDHADWRGKARDKSPLIAALDAFDDAQRKESSRGHTQADASRAFNPHRFEVAFGRDEQTGRILALLFTEQEPFRTAWEALAEVEPYGYWNNTDAPDGVTSDEWTARRGAWERVMPGYSPPVQSMLTFKLRGDVYDTGMMGLVMDSKRKPEVAALLREFAPSDEVRIERVVMNAIFTRWREVATFEGDNRDVSRFMSVLRKIRTGDTGGVESAVAAELAPREEMFAYVFNGAPTDEPVTRSMDASGIETAAAAWVEANLARAQDGLPLDANSRRGATT